MTAEVAFAKTFLATLDSRPTKFQSDYAADLKELEITAPYTLPRMSKPMTRPEASSSSTAATTSASGQHAPGSEPAASVTLRSLRNPPLELSLPAQALSTSVLDLKQRVAQELGLSGTDKIRLLYQKKPCADSKSIKELLQQGSDGDDGAAAKAVEFSVMVIGGVPQRREAEEGAKKEAGTEATTGASVDTPMEDASVSARGESAVDVMQSTTFWQDLEGFLEQRTKSQPVAEEATRLFEAAWRERGTS